MSGDASVIIQPPLPVGDLPEFEGVQPVGVVTRVNGTGQRIHRALHLGERGVLVLEYEVRNVGHNRTDEGPKRTHTLSVVDLYELPGDEGHDVLARARSAYREANGEPPLGNGDVEPFRGDAIVTDSNGVVLTPSERAEVGLPPLPDEDDDEDAPDDEDLVAAAAADREVHDELAARRKLPPLADQDELSARDVIAAVRDTVDRDYVLAIGNYEEDHKARQTVLDAVMKRSAQLLEG